MYLSYKIIYIKLTSNEKGDCFMFFYIKILILMLILFVCTYLGNLKAKSFDTRVIELKKIRNALNMFKTKIQFTYEPIKDIFMEISHIIYKDNNNIFKNTIKRLNDKTVYEAWIESVDISENGFDKEDRETIKMLGKLLGKTDKIGQISEIDLTSNFIDKQIEKSEYEKSKNTKLYKTLGTVVGLAIIIILI